MYAQEPTPYANRMDLLISDIIHEKGSLLHISFLVSMMRSFLSFSQKMLLIALAPGDTLRKQQATAIFLKMQHHMLETDGMPYHVTAHRDADETLCGLEHTGSLASCFHTRLLDLSLVLAFDANSCTRLCVLLILANKIHGSSELIIPSQLRLSQCTLGFDTNSCIIDKLHGCIKSFQIRYHVLSPVTQKLLVRRMVNKSREEGPENMDGWFPLCLNFAIHH